jgi:SAM-dependent methyltransferase
VASPPDTSDIYRNYIYESSSSPDLLEHFSRYAEFVKDIAATTEKPVLEIGANDGLLLSQLVRVGFSRLVGIDPSPQTAGISLSGVQVVNDFFSEKTAKKLDPQSFSAIIANNCFSHIPQLTNVLSLCGELLEQSGTLIVEVQSTLDLIEGVIFDYVYHEHYFYHTATSFEVIARMSGLELYGIHHVSTKGGSYRLLLGHIGKHVRDGSVDYWKFREEVAQVHSRKPWVDMDVYLSTVKASLHRLISKSHGKIAAYGACATGTVFLKYMGLEGVIDFIVDDNPKRQGRFAPGTGIPVLPPSSCKDASLCLVLAWRHAQCIVPKLESLGISYIVPLPELTYA